MTAATSTIVVHQVSYTDLPQSHLYGTAVTPRRILAEMIATVGGNAEATAGRTATCNFASYINDLPSDAKLEGEVFYTVADKVSKTAVTLATATPTITTAAGKGKTRIGVIICINNNYPF